MVKQANTFKSQWENKTFGKYIYVHKQQYNILDGLNKIS